LDRLAEFGSHPVIHSLAPRTGALNAPPSSGRLTIYRSSLIGRADRVDLRVGVVLASYLPGRRWQPAVSIRATSTSYVLKPASDAAGPRVISFGRNNNAVSPVQAKRQRTLELPLLDPVRNDKEGAT
jgi:hypothetical protein